MITNFQLFFEIIPKERLPFSTTNVTGNSCFAIILHSFIIAHTWDIVYLYFGLKMKQEQTAFAPVTSAVLSEKQISFSLYQKTHSKWR